MYFNPDSAEFRAGACHAALWLSKEAQRMIEEGRPVDEVAAYLADLNEVVIEWQNRRTDIPTGPPWHWEADELAHFIAMRKSEW